MHQASAKCLVMDKSHLDLRLHIVVELLKLWFRILSGLEISQTGSKTRVYNKNDGSVLGGNN